MHFIRSMGVVVGSFLLALVCEELGATWEVAFIGFNAYGLAVQDWRG